MTEFYEFALKEPLVAGVVAVCATWFFSRVFTVLFGDTPSVINHYYECGCEEDDDEEETNFE